MRKLCVMLLLIGFPIVCYCQSDFEIAQEFMKRKGITLSESRSSTRTIDTSYNVFESVDGKGYAVVENGMVIAYSTEETSDKFVLRTNTRGYEYDKELRPKTPITPMIEAKYDQVSKPYRDLLPIIEGPFPYIYANAMVGCGPLAVTKIMYYYKNEGCDSLERIDYDGVYPTLEPLPPTKFDWNNILPEYIEGQYNDEQAFEVAKLIKYVGYALHSEYGTSATGSWVKPQWLTNLGFSDESYSSVGDKYDIGSNEWGISFDDWGKTDLELEAMLDKELEQGRPVMMAGYNRELSVGHWCVIDGRDDTGRYHIDDMGYMVISQDVYAKYGDSVDILWMLNRVWLVVPIYYPPTSTNLNNATYTSNCGSVYNLQGCKVGDSLEGLKSGIYIVGGKKYVVK